ncbi:MAG: hypothetical protein ACP5NV_04430 [Candidatus Woesearchaeota archaeon]
MIGHNIKNNDVFIYIKPEEIKSGEYTIQGTYFDYSEKRMGLELIVCDLNGEKTSITHENNNKIIRVNRNYFENISERNLEDHKGHTHVNLISTDRMNMFEQEDYADLIKQEKDL